MLQVTLHSIGMFIWASIRLVAGGAHLPDAVVPLMWVISPPTSNSLPRNSVTKAEKVVNQLGEAYNIYR